MGDRRRCSLVIVFKIFLEDIMVISVENIYMVGYNGDGNVVFVDIEKIDDRYVIYVLGGGVGVVGV